MTDLTLWFSLCKTSRKMMTFFNVGDIVHGWSDGVSNDSNTVGSLQKIEKEIALKGGRFPAIQTTTNTAI